MKKRLIRLTESDLHRIVKESVDAVMANLNRHNSKPEPPVEDKEEIPKDHIYSVKELKWMYEHYRELNDIERKVLDAAMWVRARLANYHGYTKEWHNIALKDGKTYWYYNGELLRTPHR